jgi:hypothetical protein
VAGFVLHCREELVRRSFAVLEPSEFLVSLVIAVSFGLNPPQVS